MSPDEGSPAKGVARLAAVAVALRMLLRRRAPRQGRREPPPPAPESEDDPRERTVPANRRAETVVAALLLLAALFGFGFTVVYVVRPSNTQLLGLAIGGMLGLLAAAAILAGKRVVPQETSVEERGPLLVEEQTEEIVEMIEEGGEGITRRLLLAGAGGLAGAAAVTAAATPLASLGPRLTQIHTSPWQRGRRMVDEQGRPFLASAIEIGSFYTALPEGADWEQLSSPLLLVRLPPHYIHLPPSRSGWAPDGILAYSKTCTHAACALSLYRYPTFAPTTGDVPAFTCPCHYSTFLPGEGGRVSFGPAGRPLPQLPVMIDGSGYLVAGGQFDEDTGPSWIDVRRPSA